VPIPGPDKALCGSQRMGQRPGVTCRQVAGARADRLGAGRCWRHGGCTANHQQAAGVELARSGGREERLAEQLSTSRRKIAQRDPARVRASLRAR
jgi:hypothetical protein